MNQYESIMPKRSTGSVTYIKVNANHGHILRMEKKKYNYNQTKCLHREGGGYPIYINKSDRNHSVPSFGAQYICIHTLRYMQYNKNIANTTAVVLSHTKAKCHHYR